MQILLKRIHVIFTIVIVIVISTIVHAVAEPKDEMRSLVVTADYHPVNVNKASTSRLAVALRGVGLKTATAIVAYRKANCPFKTIDELTSVKGVSARTPSKNERVIVLE
jgi:competence protein ComEA